MKKAFFDAVPEFLDQKQLNKITESYCKERNEFFQAILFGDCGTRPSRKYNSPKFEEKW